MRDRIHESTAPVIGFNACDVFVFLSFSPPLLIAGHSHWLDVLVVMGSG